MIYNNKIYYFSESQTIKSEKILKPFWEVKKEGNPNLKRKKRIKFVFKWFKFIVYSFIFIITLWGCVQQFSQTYTTTASSVGQGLEFGFSPGTTGDWRFDLSGASTGTYWVFNNYSLTFGPFFAWFVYPFAKLTLAISYGLSPALSVGGFDTLFTIIIILLIMRGITFWPSLKTSLLTEKQMEHQGAISEINAKYANIDKSDKQAKMRKQQEVRDYQIKHNLKPFSALENIFTSTPIFLIIFKLVTIVRPIKATVLFGIWDMSEIPFNAIFQGFSSGGWVYIFLLFFVLPTQFMGQKLPQILTKRRNRKALMMSQKGKTSNKTSNRVQNITIFVFLIFPLFTSSGIGLYYFFSALFTITQTIIIHKIIVKRRKEGFTIDDYLERFGIKQQSETKSSVGLFSKKRN